MVNSDFPYQVKGTSSLDLIIESILRKRANYHALSDMWKKNILAPAFVRQDDLQILLPQYINIENHSINLF
jgi:hypothetical protein